MYLLFLFVEQDHAAIMLSLILMLLGVAVDSTKGPRHPTASHHHYHPQPSVVVKLTEDDRILHDAHHINEDLGKWAEDSHLTDEELEFRYFKVHDFDNNTKLDGLEIYQAIKHSMETAEPPYMEERTIITLIDEVLSEDDTDFDGYLSYAEYVIGRQREKDRRNKK